MTRITTYAIAGCFIGTVAALTLNKYNPSPFLLFLIPMWGMVLSVAVARVVNLHETEEVV